MNDFRIPTSITRRNAVASIAASAVLLASGMSRASAQSQQATPSALPVGISEWIAGWQSLDADRIAAIYTEDAIHEVVATGEVISGREAIRANIAGLMTAIPDTALTVNQAFSAENAGVVDWSYAGHYTNQFPGFPAPTGQAIAFRATTIFALDGDMVVRSTEFYDLYGLFVQLGLLPAPGGEMTPDATPG
jgi:steroid delta-isomerase-like uncharacterized protein